MNPVLFQVMFRSSVRATIPMAIRFQDTRTITFNIYRIPSIVFALLAEPVFGNQVSMEVVTRIVLTLIKTCGKFKNLRTLRQLRLAPIPLMIR